MAGNTAIVPAERILRLILLIRRQKVILDADIAALYGVQTGMLVRAVKRNLDRFPPDFMFQLSKDEFDNLRSQFVTSSKDEFDNLRCQLGTSSSWGGRRYAPLLKSAPGDRILAFRDGGAGAELRRVR